MNGIINVIKPPGMTSFDMVAVLRNMLHIKRIGHTGTLDPAATGVLPVCIGNATKAIEYLTDKVKKYRVELTLGITTDTQDSTGRITGEKRVDVEAEDIVKVIKSFKGKQKQIPPMYSAVSVDGVRLYRLARSGVEVERPPRDIEIYEIDVIDIKNCRTVLFDVKCSKGTYIRTLCADIGEKLGCGGHMSFLLRLEAGMFKLDDAYTLEQLSELVAEGRIDNALVKTDEVFMEYREVLLSGRDEKKILNGAFITLGEHETFKPGEKIRIYNSDRCFLAIAEVMVYGGKKILKARKLYM